MIPNLQYREIAFTGSIEGEFIMHRHKRFYTDEQVHEYYLDNDSWLDGGIFASVAYYDYPDARRMKNKEHFGADLAIDLDVGTTPEYRLSKCKFMARRCYKLLRRWFGLNELQVVFSGNRGFHIYARDECIRSLKCNHRGEIADCLEIKGRIDLDRGVTTDVKRLMRYPGSRHPKTGKMVRLLKITELGEFKP